MEKSATKTERVVPHGSFLARVIFKIIGVMAVIVGIGLVFSGRIVGVIVAAAGALCLLIALHAGKGK